MKKKMIIEGMKCKQCVMHVVKALEEAGAEDVNVSLEENTAYADFANGTSDENIKSAVEDAGYDVASIKNI